MSAMASNAQIRADEVIIFTLMNSDSDVEDSLLFSEMVEDSSLGFRLLVWVAHLNTRTTACIDAWNTIQ